MMEKLLKIFECDEICLCLGRNLGDPEVNNMQEEVEFRKFEKSYVFEEFEKIFTINVKKEDFQKLSQF